jgi:hypothetical protein
VIKRLLDARRPKSSTATRFAEIADEDPVQKMMRFRDLARPSMLFVECTVCEVRLPYGVLHKCFKSASRY